MQNVDVTGVLDFGRMFIEEKRNRINYNQTGPGRKSSFRHPRLTPMSAEDRVWNKLKPHFNNAKEI